MLLTRAPAKINLTLHVLSRRQDGFHVLESLVAFTGAGDTLSLSEHSKLSLQVTGPTAQPAGDGDDNLVLRASRHLADRVTGLRHGAFHLVKRLPVAAGIGGGSSDAAAALRLLAQLNNIPLTDPRLQEAAKYTGSDVPVCLEAHARMMKGAGEILGPALTLPTLPAVLINPGVPVETKPIFQKLGLSPGDVFTTTPHPDIPTNCSFGGLIDLIKQGRNDLEDAACLQAPIILDVLSVLRSARGTKIARMSGSGATCFALFETPRAAAKASRAIRTARPDWWVKTAVLR